MRRDQERKEKKAEKEKEKRRAERRASRRGLFRRGGGGGGGGGARNSGSGNGGSAKRGSDAGARPRRAPGRFSGWLMGATVAFILLQGIVTPEADLGLLDRIAAAGFFGLYAYFATLWLYRMGREQAAGLAAFSGGMLALGVELGKAFRGGYSPDLIVLGLIVLFLPLGAVLGRLVWTRSPR